MVCGIINNANFAAYPGSVARIGYIIIKEDLKSEIQEEVCAGGTDAAGNCVGAAAGGV